VRHRGDAVRRFDDDVERRAWRQLYLEEEEVGEGRLRPLDLRRQDSLAPDAGVEEEVGIGEQRGDAVEPTAGEQRAPPAPAARRSSRSAASGGSGCGTNAPTASPEVVDVS